MELQQSPLYKKYIMRLGWKTIEIDGSTIFIRNIPLVGALAKIQRIEKLPDVTTCIALLRNHKVKTIAIEPAPNISDQQLSSYVHLLTSSGFHINRSAFIPTKTIRVDLRKPLEEIFNSFSEAKRRAVRRAEKNHVHVGESNDIDALIRTKNRSAGLFGFITTSGVRELWQTFAPKHATTILAFNDKNKEPIAGVLLIFWNHVAYYWIVGSTKDGKKLFAPTLVVWESIKVSKSRGCKWFDFVGVWDERLPKQNHDWKGFTKFKEGFGGETLYYPIANLRQAQKFANSRLRI